MNHAVHQIDLFQWMMGMPDELQAVVTNINHENSEVEDFSTAVMLYKSGAVGQVTASLVHHGEEQRLVFQGERGQVSAPWQVHASRQRENGFPGPNAELERELDQFYHKLPDLPFTAHDGQIANFLAAIAGDDTLLVDGHAGRNTIELVTAIYESGHLDRKIQLPLAPTALFYTRQGILHHAHRFHEKKRSLDNFDDNTITTGSDYKGAGSSQPS
jgi:predicted dehydrogenase